MNEVAGKHQAWGLVDSGTNHVMRGLEHSVPPSPPLERGEVLERKFNHQWSAASSSHLPNAALKAQGSRASGLRHTWRCWECGAWGGHGSVSYSSTWIKPEEGAWEPLIYSQLVRSTGNNWCFWLESEVPEGVVGTSNMEQVGQKHG